MLGLPWVLCTLDAGTGRNVKKGSRSVRQAWHRSEVNTCLWLGPWSLALSPQVASCGFSFGKVSLPLLI